MQVAHKIELKPNNKQKTYFKKACGVARFAYNWGLAEWNKQYKEDKKPTAYQLKKEFNSLKKDKFPWTYQVTKYASQQPFIDLQSAFKKFFTKQAGYPQFKKKNKTADSFYIGGDQIKIKDKKIHIPNLGLVRLKECLRFVGKINSVVISRTADHWFAAVQVEIKNDIISSTTITDRIVGVDLGVNQLVVTSDGHALAAPKPLKKKLRQLKRQQRILAKKIRVAKKEKRVLGDAKNFWKQKTVVQKIHYKVANIRRDTLHKVTSFLVNNYTEIAIEDLNVAGMLKNHKLARNISDVGFGEFRRQLSYKTNWRKNNLVIVNRFYPSSKTCSKCNRIKDELSLSERIFICECGNTQDRDFNASLNLKQKIGRVPSEFTPVEIACTAKISLSDFCNQYR